MPLHIRSILTITVVGLAVCAVTGCGPTKEGIQARVNAQDRMDRVNAQMAYDKARKALEVGQLKTALLDINAAVKRYPDIPDFHVLQGRVLLEMHRLEPAARAFQTALDLADPESEVAEEARITPSYPGMPEPEESAEAHYFLGIVYQRWSNSEMAFEHYHRALELEDTNIQYLLAAAESMVAMQRFDEAMALLKPRMDYFENNAALHQLLGQIAMLRRDATLAAEHYASARLLAPDDPALLEELIWVQFKSQQYGRCHELIKEYQRKFEADRVDLDHLEARCLAIMERSTEARDLYMELSRRVPSDVDIWSELGTLAWELGDYRRVAQSSVRLIALAPQRFEGYMLKGLNEQHKGNLDEAIRLFDQSAERSTDVALPHVLLGMALEQRGRTDDAAAAYQEALRIDGGHREARALLQRVREGSRIVAEPTEFN